MTTWKPIHCAPRDRVILTDEGTARYVSAKEAGIAGAGGWYLCYSCGDLPLPPASDNPDSCSVSPSVWIDLPKPGVPQRDIFITPRPAELGVGWQLRLLEYGEEVGGGVFPAGSSQSEQDNAYNEALAEAEEWLDSLYGGHQNASA